MFETFEQWDRKQREWIDRIRAEHERLGADCPCGNGIDPRRVTPTVGPYWVTGVQSEEDAK